MNPAQIEVQICAENCPAITRLCILNKGSLWQNASLKPSMRDNLQKTPYVGKSGFLGPKMIVSKINSLIRKATKPNMTTAMVDLIRCHLNSSRWSRKDISLGFFSVFTIT